MTESAGLRREAGDEKRRAGLSMGARTALGTLLAWIGLAWSAAAEPIPLISPWMDHHDRIESILDRLDPTVEIRRFDLSRIGPKGKGDWWPAWGFPSEVPLDAPLVILENAPLTALQRMRSTDGTRLDLALDAWVRAGGHLLIVGGPPSLEQYGGSPLEALMGFSPASDPKHFETRTRRPIRGGGSDDLFVERLHAGRVTTATVRLQAGRKPFLLDQAVGRGRVTTLLSGAQGGFRKDGGEPAEEWFESRAWDVLLRSIVARAHGFEFAWALPAAPLPRRTPPPVDAFDVRAFMIGHQPHPLTRSPGEAGRWARKLRDLGFTSVVYGAHARRRKDDLRALQEIADAGLRIVYYDGFRPTTPESRFRSEHVPPRRQDASGKDVGWDIHSDAFRGALEGLLDGREAVRSLPLRAVQVIEEFQDGVAVGPGLGRALRIHRVERGLEPGAPGWLAAQQVRADETHTTFQSFREIAQRLFPGLPLSTYWPGSYWHRPNDYVYRLSTLGEAVDEILGPGYGYGSTRRWTGPESVRWSANSGWGVLRDSTSPKPHLAVYAMGRPLGAPKEGRGPSLQDWRETAWTALAHGATGLAYWAIPQGGFVDGLADLHQETARLGPWLAAVPRTAAPVALLESWTARTNDGDPATAAGLARCLKDTHAALELGFGDVDAILEERLDRLPAETRALAVVASPIVSEAAAASLVAFARRGGQIFVEPGSLVRTAPGDRPLDLAARIGGSGSLHTLPTLARCRGARISPHRAGRAWAEALADRGISPRLATKDDETGVAVRADAEIAHVYAINHGETARPLQVELGQDVAPGGRRVWGPRAWTELRSGTPATARGGRTLSSEGPVAPGEAVVWGAIARPAERITASLRREAGRLALTIQGRDAAGTVLAEGYPIAFSIVGTEAPGCNSAGVSTVLRGGQAQIELETCATACAVPGTCQLIDPMTRRTWPVGTEGD